MTEQQQNILDLFNSGDLVNRELAEEVAIATGNGQWFSEMIDYNISQVKAIIKKYCKIKVFIKTAAYTCYDDIAILQLMLYGAFGESFSSHFEMHTEKIIINEESYQVYFTFDRSDDCCTYEEYNLQKELKEIGLEITIY